MTAARNTSLKWNCSELSPSFLDHISLKKKNLRGALMFLLGNKVLDVFNPLQPS